MGFLGDVLNGILEGDGNFGQRLSSNNEPLRNLYQRMYYDFGLTSPRNIKEGQLVPMTIGTWGSKALRFEIRGKILSPHNFMGRGWDSPFHRIDREITPIRGRVWSYGIERLYEGILTAEAVFPNDEAHRRSEEYLKILRTVGIAPLGALHTVPAIQLGFGEIWARYGIPDRIFIALDAAYPLSDDSLQRIVSLILHAYNRTPAPPVTADYSKNTADATITLTMRENSVPPTAPAPAGTRPQHQSQASATPAPKPYQPDPSDGFPYDFYRGLGLITDENMVLIPTPFGPDFPIAFPMTSDTAKEHLLNYKP